VYGFSSPICVPLSLTVYSYSVNGNVYLFAPSFEKNQVGLRKARESQSKILPPPPELLRSKSGISPSQVQDKENNKYREMEEGDTELFDKFRDEFLETYKRSPDAFETGLLQEMAKDEALRDCSGNLIKKAFQEAVNRGKGLKYAEVVLRDYK